MNISDIVGLSKPLTRLIEVISKGVGAVSTPYLIRKNADAKVYEIGAISKALSDVAKQLNIPVVYRDGSINAWQKEDDHALILETKRVDDRSDKRVDYQSRKEQANIENVTSVAAIELAEVETVAPELPDDDWVTRFFKYAQDVSSEQMQDLWGRILAGEIRSPGSYSLRTLDSVRNLTKADAELFQRLGKLAIRWGDTAFVYSKSRNLDPSMYIDLAESGLTFPSSLNLLAFRNEKITKELFLHGNRVLIVERSENQSDFRVDAWKFTKTGMELLPLVEIPTDDEYLKEFARAFVSRDYKAFIGPISAMRPDLSMDYTFAHEVVNPGR